jgi:hypothetical protein
VPEDEHRRATFAAAFARAFVLAFDRREPL